MIEYTENTPYNIESHALPLEEKLVLIEHGERAKEFVDDPDFRVRQHVAQYADVSALDDLVFDVSYIVRAELAKRANSEQFDELRRDPMAEVIFSLIEGGYADSFVDHHDPRVRCAVARYGRAKHLDALVDDEHYTVRATVAFTGSDNHREILTRDENPVVQRIAQHYEDISKGIHEGVDSDDPHVRLFVALSGSLDDIKRLVDDPYVIVRDTAKEQVYMWESLHGSDLASESYVWHGMFFDKNSHMINHESADCSELNSAFREYYSRSHPE